VAGKSGRGDLGEQVPPRPPAGTREPAGQANLLKFGETLSAAMGRVNRPAGAADKLDASIPT
jgi:hypothetical protein